MQAEQVNTLTIVGDAMGRPLVDALEAAAAADRPYDMSSLCVIASGGALFSASIKDRLTAIVPHALIIDGFGSSETGVLGTQGTNSSTALFITPTASPHPEEMIPME